MLRLIRTHRILVCGILICVAIGVSRAETKSQSAASSQPASSTPQLDPRIVQLIQEANEDKTYQDSELSGGAFASFPFEEVSPDGLLVGLRIGLGKFTNSDVVTFVQPIYLTASGEKLGRGYGQAHGQIVDAKAPPGYAVGSATIRGGGGLDALTLRFNRIRHTRLNPDDACVTTQVGGNGGGETTLGGDGTPVIGICGRYDAKRQFLGFGLVFLDSSPTAKTH